MPMAIKSNFSFGAGTPTVDSTRFRPGVPTLKESDVRICIVGAGSIGSFVGARLAGTGAEVTLVARGATLRALQSGGLRLIEGDGTSSVHRLRAVPSVLEEG